MGGLDHPHQGRGEEAASASTGGRTRCEARPGRWKCGAFMEDVSRMVKKHVSGLQEFSHAYMTVIILKVAGLRGFGVCCIVFLFLFVGVV